MSLDLMVLHLISSILLIIRYHDLFDNDAQLIRPRPRPKERDGEKVRFGFLTSKRGMSLAIESVVFVTLQDNPDYFFVKGWCTETFHGDLVKALEGLFHLNLVNSIMLTPRLPQMQEERHLRSPDRNGEDDR